MKYPVAMIALAALVCVAPTAALGQRPPSSNQVRIRHCMVSLVHEAHVPAEFSNRGSNSLQGGVIRQFPVKEGMAVKMGEVIAQLDDTEAQLIHQLSQLDYAKAQKQATNDVNIQAARKTKEVAEAEHDEGIEINQRSPGSVPQAELRRLKLTAERSGLQIEVAQLEYDVAKFDEQISKKALDLAETVVEKLQIKSPIDGVVVKRYLQVGEWVKAGDPVVHVVDMKNLRVEGFVDASELAPQDIFGRTVTIEVALTKGRIVKYTAVLNFVSPIVEASGDYRVWADVQNKEAGNFWELRPGLPAEMVIHLD